MARGFLRYHFFDSRFFWGGLLGRRLWFCWFRIRRLERFHLGFGRFWDCRDVDLAFGKTHQEFLGAEGGAFAGVGGAEVAAIFLHEAGFGGVGEVSRQDLVVNAGLCGLVFDRKYDFAALEGARLTL
jgi:hypothetical protein